VCWLEQYAYLLLHNIHRGEQHTQAFLGWQRTAAQQQSKLCCNVLDVLDTVTWNTASEKCAVIRKQLESLLLPDGALPSVSHARLMRCTNLLSSRSPGNNSGNFS